MERFSSDEIIPGIGVASLVFFARISRKIKDPIRKKWFSSLVGVIVIVTVCGWGSLHIGLCILGNMIIIFYGNKSRCFFRSFVFTFTHFSIYNIEELVEYPLVSVYTKPYFMFMVLKTIQLAGDVQDSFNEKISTNGSDLPKKSLIHTNLTFLDACHYLTCSVGLLTFFRYRTYYDWLHCPLDIEAKCVTESRRKLGHIIIMAVVALMLVAVVSPEYIRSPQFYEENLSRRIFYTIIIATTVRLVVYSILSAQDMQCALAGVGLYPADTQPRPGHGPTTRVELIDEIYENPSACTAYEFNFDAIKNIDIYEAEVGSVTCRKGWRSYNCSLQYFFASNVYKRWPMKQSRLFATFLISLLWHGLHGGRFIATISLMGHYLAEDVFFSLYRKNASGKQAKIWDGTSLIFRFFIGSLIGVAPVYLQYFVPTFRFFASFYCFFFFLPFLLYALGLGLKGWRDFTRMEPKNM